MSIDLSGAFTALYTPFDAAGAVDEAALTALCERQVEAGVGLVPCGTTGETPTLSAAEQALVIRTAVRVADGKVPVVAGASDNDTRLAVGLAQRATELGADAVLVSAPWYNKPPQRSLIAHFTAVADDGGSPVMLYNVPGRAAVNMAAETTLALAEHPQILAVKEASANLDQIQAVLAGAPDGFRVLSGDDAWTLPMMLLGGHGVVSVAGNVFPKSIAALVATAQSGDLARARRLQWQLMPLFRSLFLTTNPIPVKRAASLLGHCRADLRLPLCADEVDETILAELQAQVGRVRGLEAEA